MAEKKVKEEVAVEAPAARVPVFVPKEGKGDDDLYLCVNGRRMLIQKGKTVYLPPEFAEVVEHMFEARAEADAYIDQTSNG